MAQPHKGPRTQVNVAVPDQVLARIERDRIAFEVSSTSQYLADLVCHLLGRPDAARELECGGEQLRLSCMPHRGALGETTPAEHEFPEITEPVKLRIPDVVIELLDQKVAEDPSSSRKSYLETLLGAAYGRADSAADLIRQEERMMLSLVGLSYDGAPPEKGADGQMQLTA